MAANSSLRRYSSQRPWPRRTAFAPASPALRLTTWCAMPTCGVGHIMLLTSCPASHPNHYFVQLGRFLTPQVADTPGEGLSLRAGLRRDKRPPHRDHHRKGWVPGSLSCSPAAKLRQSVFNLSCPTAVTVLPALHCHCESPKPLLSNIRRRAAGRAAPAAVGRGPER